MVTRSELRRNGRHDAAAQRRAHPGIAVTVEAAPGRAALREWDGFVDTVLGSDVAQLSAWGRIRADAGFRPLHVVARQDGRLVGGALVLERRLPVLGSVGYVSNGPLVGAGTPRPAVVDALVDALDGLARGRLRALFVQPPVDAHDVGAGLRGRGFRPSTVGVAPAASVRVDLRRDTDALLADLSKANRRRTRRWAQRGVTVRTGAPADLGDVAELLARTAEHQGFEPLSADYVRRLYRELDADGHAVAFVVELDAEPVAALLCTRSGGTVRQRIQGMDRSERARKEGVAAAAVWHAMLWAKAQGCHTYDFGGMRADAARRLLDGTAEGAAALTGPEQFKTTFGGEAFLYPEPVELIGPPVLRAAYDLSRNTRLGTSAVALGRRVLRGGR